MGQAQTKHAFRPSSGGLAALAIVVLGAVVLCMVGCEPGVDAPSTPQSATVADPAAPRTAQFGAVPPSAEVRAVANWVVASDDHEGLPFAVVDKNGARGYVFSAEGRLVGDSPVLVGLTRGDEVVPGIGKRAVAEVLPEERRTPAGRFVGVAGHTTSGDRVVWLDYDEGIAMHTVVTNVPAEERLRRMASLDASDHRISYGCINFPPPFFSDVLAPTLARRGSIVYVLPDTRPLKDVFPALYLAGRQARAARPVRAADR